MAATQQAPTLSFRRGASPLMYVMQTNPWSSGQLTTPWPVPRQGFARRIRMFAQGSSVAGATPPTLTEDYPWAIVKQCSFLDPDGTPIVQLSGFQAHLYEKYLAGWAGGDISKSAAANIYSAANAASSTNLVNFSFVLPLAVNNRDTLGVLANEDPNQGYSVQLQGELTANIWTANAPTSPAVNFTPLYEYFSQPPFKDVHTGAGYDQFPPELGAVHRVFVQRTNITGTGSRAVTIPLKTGDIYRGFILIFRANGLRATAETTPPTQIRFMYGNNVTYLALADYQIRDKMYEAEGVDADSGVYMFNFTEDSGLRPGNELRRDLFNSGDVAQAWIEVDLPSGYNTTNAYVETIQDSIMAPPQMFI